MRDLVDDLDTNEKQQVTSAYSLNVEDDDVNEDHADLLSIIYMGMEIGRLGAVKTLYDKFKDFNDSQISDASHADRVNIKGLMRDVDVTNGWITMGDMAYETYIRKKKDGGATVIIPVQKDQSIGFTSLSKSYMRSDYFSNYSTPTDQLIQALHKRFQEMFSKDFWDIDKGTVFTATCDRKLYAGLTLEGIDDDIDNVYAMIDWIKAIHIISPKVGGTQNSRKVRNLEQAKENGEDLENFRNTVLSVRKLTFAIEIDMEAAHVRYVTQNENPSEAELGIYLTSKIKGACQDLYEPDCFMPPNIIAQKTAKLRKVNRLNDLQLTINSAGSPMYIPRIAGSGGFITDVQKAGSNTPLGWSLASSFDNNEGKTAISNKLVFTDEINSMLSYINNGEVVSIDLSDCVPFEAQHATQFAKSTIIMESAALKSLAAFNYALARNPDVFDKIKVNPKEFSALIHPRNGTMVSEFANIYTNPDRDGFADEVIDVMRRGIIPYINEVTRMVRRLGVQYGFEMERDDTFELPESHDWVDKYDVAEYNLSMLAPDSVIPPLRPLAQLIQELAKIIIADPLANVESRSISQGIVAVGFAFYANKYLNRLPEVEKQAQAYLDTLKLPVPTKKWTAPALPGVNANFSFLPHQGGVTQKMVSNPRYMILAVDAGGGKTLLAATKCIQLINDGMYKKPLIICPNYLISNYVQDLITLTDGRWNIIPITRTTILSHGEAKIFAMVTNAPPNTLFVTDYNFIKGSVIEVPYGTSVMTISENSNYLRDMGFDCAFLDESHTVKNPNSQTTIAALKLISSMQMICLMSGTVIHGGAQDLYAQVMLLDPTVFGSWEDFKREYADTWKGDKITVWKTGAERKMMERIRSRIAYIQVKKKEWAALLPERVERFHGVELNAAQRKVYQAILESVLDEIYNDPQMKKRLAESSADQEDFELEAKLNAYLARIEKFLAAPGTDEFSGILSEDDWVSPKVAKIAEIIKEHWKRKIPGKILIFTSFVPSAEEIYKYLPDNIRSRTILYKAASKSKNKAMFMGDDKYQVMIGVEQSLNTGHNFQNASRIIRVESVWNPGTLEQAESRIFRPDVKNKFGISEKYLDWVLAEGTIDVTKAARLMSKILWNVAIEELDNPIYDGLPQVELISMNLTNIASENDWVTSLARHIDAYKAYRDAQKEDYAEYLKLPGILDKPFHVPSAPMMKNSAIIEGVPYIENHTLPYQDELGLKSLTQYASDLKEGPDTLDAKGLWVHTEFGDGVVTRNATGTLWVQLKNGKIIRGIAKEKVFVFNDQKEGRKSTVSIAQRLRKLLDLPTIAVTQSQLKNAESFLDDTEALSEDLKVEVNEEDEKPAKATKPKKADKPKESEKKRPNPNTDTEANGSFSLWSSAINGQIGVAIDDDDPDTPKASVLEELGFKFSGKYAYARIRSRAVMDNLVEFVQANLKKGNIALAPVLMEEMLEVQQAWAQSKTKARTVDMLTQQEMRNYYIMRIRKPKDSKSVILTFLVQDGELYAIVDLEKTPRGKAFTSRKISGVNWEESDGEYIAFFSKKSKAKAFVKELRKTYNINNIDDFKEQLSEIVVKARQ